MQCNSDKPRRRTVTLDKYLIKNLRVLQSELIKTGNRQVSFSEVVELLLREKLKM